MTDSKSPRPDSPFEHLVKTVHRLRAPNGCPWDRAQTHQSLRRHLIEEAYEVLDVLDEIDTPEKLQHPEVRDPFKEELGDLLMQVLLHSEMASETGAFTIDDVAKTLDEKLVRRHPHVFGDQSAGNADEALKNWEQEKAKEKTKAALTASGQQGQPAKASSVLDGLPKNLPALQRTARMIEKVTQVGFQWKDLNGPLDKVEEELQELKAEVRAFEKAADSEKPKLQKKVEGELGDLLFSLCNVGYLLHLNPEESLRSTMARFERRFRYIENRLSEQGKRPDTSDQNEMDRFWNEAKKVERVKIWGLTGGIGAGKSAAASIFQELGIPVIDADQIARELTQEKGLALESVIVRFGTADRGQLRKLVFEDPRARKDLEEILHPLIRAESQRRIQALAPKHPVVIYEAALLVETGRYRDFDGLIVIEAPEEVRKKRIVARDGITIELAQQMIRAQTSDPNRNAVADQVLKNDGDLDRLRTQIRELCSLLFA